MLEGEFTDYRVSAAIVLEALGVDDAYLATQCDPDRCLLLLADIAASDELAKFLQYMRS